MSRTNNTFEVEVLVKVKIHSDNAWAARRVAKALCDHPMTTAMLEGVGETMPGVQILRCRKVFPTQ